MVCQSAWVGVTIIVQCVYIVEAYRGHLRVVTGFSFIRTKPSMLMNIS